MNVTKTSFALFLYRSLSQSVISASIVNAKNVEFEKSPVVIHVPHPKVKYCKDMPCVRYRCLKDVFYTL